MALKVIPWLSPRLGLVLAPETNRSIQALSDDLKDWEDEPANLSYPILVRTAGKEDLGGGVSVGITATLQNTVIAFEQRGTSVSQGTVTTADVGGSILHDSGATFISDGVIPGAAIINLTDKSVGTVVQVISETEVRLLQTLEDGVSNQFTFGDEYKIWNIIQCEVDGGNLVAVDGGGSTISSVFPTFGTQIVRTSSSSATLTETQELRDLTYGGVISLDTSSLVTGTEFPAGNLSNPVNNIADATLLMVEKGFSEIVIRGSITLAQTYNNVLFRSFGGHASENLDLNGQDVNGCSFINLQVTGSMVGSNVGFDGCKLTNISGFNGDASNCGIEGTITMAAGASVLFDKCHSDVAGTTTPFYDINSGANTIIQIRSYSGGAEIRNFDQASNVGSIDLTSGHIKLASTCSDGVLVARGTGHITDDSTGTTVVTTGLSEGYKLDELHKLQGLDIDNPMSVSPTQRTSDGIDLNISKVGDTVTVQRV